MQSIPVNELFNKVGSIYKLVVLAAMRAIELNEGAARLVEARPDEKPGNVALQEILEGKVMYKAKGEK